MRRPRIAELLVAALVRLVEKDEKDERRVVLDELGELYERRRRTRGALAARLWYWRQVGSFAWHLRREARGAGAARRRAGLLDSILRDLLYGGRALLRAPGFTLAALVTLALGIGANVAIWSVLHHLVLRPFGYLEEERIVRVWPEHRFTRADFDAYRERARSFDAFAAYAGVSFTLTGETTPEVVSGVLVTADHFRVFGVRPALGRDFVHEDSLAGSERVAIVSHEMWESLLGGAAVVGRPIELGGFEGGRFTVVGVAPAGFRPLGQKRDVFVALSIDPEDERYRHVANLGIVARLRPGVDSETARAELGALASEIEPPPYYLDRVPGYRVAPFGDVLVEDVEGTLWSLLGAVAVVLLLCCFNVASLLLARGASREGEIAVRLALGASASRITRQLVTENVALATLGGLAGLGLARLGSSLLVRLVPEGVPRAEAIAVDSEAALFAIALSLATSVLFGLAPALRLSTMARGIKARGFSRDLSRLHRGLVALEIALALVLVVASGLLVKSFWRLSRVETGFRGEGVLSMKLLPSTLHYPEDADRHRYYDDVLESLRTVPGVLSAGAIQLLPMTAQFMAVGYSPTGSALPSGVTPPSASYRIVTPDYRRTLGIPLLRGRDLSAADRPDAPPVGLVNETLARELWPGEDPVGKEVHYDDGSLWFTVVGVVGDVRQHRLDRAPGGEVYIPHAQDSWPSAMSIVVRARGEPAALVPLLREAVGSVDADVPIREVRTMEDVVHRSMTEPRTRALVFSGFAGLAYVLSAVGVYGVVAYTVSRTTRDIGIRLALGATGRRVLAHTLSASLGPVAVGMTLGVAVSAASTSVLSSFLYRVESTDPTVYLTVGGALLAVALGAAYVPARRATRIDPVGCLRAEG